MLLFMFLISSIFHHHPALLRRHTLILDRLLNFLAAFSTLVLKPSFSRNIRLYSCLSLPPADLTRCLAVTIAVVVLVSVAD